MEQLTAERVRRERIARTKYYEREISDKETEIKTLDKVIIESDAEKNLCIEKKNPSNGREKC